MEYQITNEQVEAYLSNLRSEEKAPATVEKYGAGIRKFRTWNGTKPVTRDGVIGFKNYLTGSYAAASVNGFVAALNGFFKFMGWSELTVKPLRLQRRLFQKPGGQLEREEYLRLVQTAESKGRKKASLLLQLMAATGLRVSEVRYITLEAVKKGRAEIRLKGKIRTILLPGKLCRKLKGYAKTQKIRSGPLFRSRKGNPLSRKTIWAMMKRLCSHAGVASGKVFPHSLRHLFARCFYQLQRDVVKLADLLGHSSVETTRIYLRSSGIEHRRLLEQMKLVC